MSCSSRSQQCKFRGGLLESGFGTLTLTRRVPSSDCIAGAFLLPSSGLMTKAWHRSDKFGKGPSRRDDAFVAESDCPKKILREHRCSHTVFISILSSQCKAVAYCSHGCQRDHWNHIGSGKSSMHAQEIKALTRLILAHGPRVSHNFG